MAEDHRLLAERKRKRQELLSLGVNPYPHDYKPSHTTAAVHEQYGTLELQQEIGDVVTVAGRLTRLARMGRIYFGDIQDERGKVQISFEYRHLSPIEQEVVKRLDTGDMVGVKGNIFRTKRGELTVKAVHLDLLAKTLAPLPDKWAGLQDEELRYRNRSLDLVMHPEIRERFRQRSVVIRTLRNVLDTHGFLEVETPLLQPVYGGATARPFETHVHALGGQRVFLSISPELYLKRLMPAFFEGVYTVCKNFRNEGIDKTHNPEFTMMECYKAWFDYQDMMRLTEEIYAQVLRATRGSTRVEYQGTTLDFTPPWPRVAMLDAIREGCAIPAGDLNEQQLRAVLQKGELPSDFYVKGIPFDDIHRWSWGEMVQTLFAYFIEPQLTQPVFIIDHPKESTPLCKGHRSDARLIERFEPFAYGVELANAYTELNDPVVQRELLEAQARAGKERGEAYHLVDHAFCDAVDLGIPPMGGLGIGVDRMVMFATNAASIKDVIFFPLMRSQDYS